MSIFNTILGRKHRSSGAKKASKVCRKLFADEHISATDMDALIALGDEGMQSFRFILARDGDYPGITRREQIIDLLGSKHISEHQQASTTDASIIALLACFLDEPEGMLGAKAVSCLATYGSGVDELLLTALKNNNSRTRSYAARALGKRNDSRAAVPLLINALHDADARVRSDVAEALGKLGDAQACEALIYALSDSNWLVRASASAALARFNDADMIHKMTRLMQHDQHQLRAQAVHILSRIDDKQALALLISALDDSHSEVQWEAVDALSGYRQAIVPLLAHYHQGDTALRQRIASACEQLGIQRVAMHLSHETSHIRIAVAELLVRFDGTDRNHTKSGHSKPDHSKSDHTNLLPLLTDAWHHESNLDVQRAIIIAIAQLVSQYGKASPDMAITTLIHATENPDKTISYYARNALESLPHALAKAFMQPTLQDSNVAIACPSCLKLLKLKPPLTAKQWSCPQCHLGFTIHKGADDVLLVTPATASLHGSNLASHSAPWFDILQLQSDADVATIKRAFRNLLKQYHPDKVAMLGTEFKQLAEQKTRLLTWALRSGLDERGE